MIPPAEQGDPFFILRRAAIRCRDLEGQLDMARGERDRMALRHVAEGHTWRKVAAAAGFTNPYLNALRKKSAAARKAGT